MRTPSGSDRVRPAMVCFTASTTLRLFSPLSMSTLAPTISPRPSRVMAPWRSPGPVSTCASCPTRAAVRLAAVLPLRCGAPDGRADVFQAAKARVAAQDDLLLLVLHVAAAGEAVVALERLAHLRDGDAVSGEARRI